MNSSSRLTLPSLWASVMPFYLLTKCTLVTIGYWFKPWLMHLFWIMIYHRLCTVIISISGNKGIMNQLNWPDNGIFLTHTLSVCFNSIFNWFILTWYCMVIRETSENNSMKISHQSCQFSRYVFIHETFILNSLIRLSQRTELHRRNWQSMYWSWCTEVRWIFNQSIWPSTFIFKLAKRSIVFSESHNMLHTLPLKYLHLL